MTLQDWIAWAKIGGNGALAKRRRRALAHQVKEWLNLTGDSYTSAGLVDAIFPERDARGVAAHAAREQVFRDLKALAQNELTGWWVDGKTNTHYGKTYRTKLWRRPDNPPLSEDDFIYVRQQAGYEPGLELCNKDDPGAIAYQRVEDWL